MRVLRRAIEAPSGVRLHCSHVWCHHSNHIPLQLRAPGSSSAQCGNDLAHFVGLGARFHALSHVKSSACSLARPTCSKTLTTGDGWAGIIWEERRCEGTDRSPCVEPCWPLIQSAYPVHMAPQRSSLSRRNQWGYFTQSFVPPTDIYAFL